MKIYIAAPWIEKELMARIAERVEAIGHIITHRWWDVETTPELERTTLILREQAVLDKQGVMNADAVLLINSSKSEGKAVEQGIALALDKPIVAVGTRGLVSKNVFHYLDNYTWCPTLEVALECLANLR